MTYSKYFRKVSNQKDLDLFYSILTPSWTEQGFELECILGEVDRYIIYDDFSNPVGTVGLVHYNSIKNIFFDLYDQYMTNNMILNANQKIIGIDELSIHPNHRSGKNLEYALYCIIEISRSQKMKFGMALINPILYRGLKSMFKLPVHQIGLPIINESYKVIPILIDVDNIYRNIQNWKWLTDIYEMDHNLARYVIFHQ